MSTRTHPWGFKLGGDVGLTLLNDGQQAVPQATTTAMGSSERGEPFQQFGTKAGHGTRTFLVNERIRARRQMRRVSFRMREGPGSTSGRGPWFGGSFRAAHPSRGTAPRTRGGRKSGPPPGGQLDGRSILMLQRLLQVGKETEEPALGINAVPPPLRPRIGAPAVTRRESPSRARPTPSKVA